MPQKPQERDPLLTSLVRALCAVLALLSVCVTGYLLVRVAMTPRESAIVGRKIAKLPIGAQIQQDLNNQLSNVLDGVANVEKVYWLRDDEQAPVPSPDHYGETDDPSTLDWLLEKADETFGKQPMYFNTDITILPGSSVRYYYDETLLVINWKTVLDYAVYTFSEVRVAHPSQFRRFLSGGKYGENTLYLTSEMAKSVNAVMAASGDFYANRHRGVIVSDGVVHLNTDGVPDICYVTRSGDLLLEHNRRFKDIAEAQEYVDKNDICFSMAFGPTLVHDGELQKYFHRYPLGETTGDYVRAAICQMGSLHYLHAAVNAEKRHTAWPTMERFAKCIAATGCEQAYALDGGQTATVVVDNKVINQVNYGSERKISDIIYFATALPQGG